MLSSTYFARTKNKTKQKDEVDTQYDIIKVEEYKKAKTICTSHCTPLIEVTHLRTQ